MNDPAWLAAERDHENSDSISVVVVPRAELEQLRAIERAARRYVEAARLVAALDTVHAPDQDRRPAFEAEAKGWDELCRLIPEEAKADAH